MEPRNYKNVLEPWTIYDTLVVSRILYGKENAVPGWYTTMADMATHEVHSLLKGRTAGSAGDQYCNQKTADRNDLPFNCFSLGIAFTAPSTRILEHNPPDLRETSQPAPVNFQDVFAAQWWECEFPNHCAIRFKVGQDVVAEGPALDFPPGSGPCGGGASLVLADSEEADRLGFCNYAASQGVPTLSNRRPFFSSIGIPKDELIECELIISQEARQIMTIIGGSGDYLIPAPNTNDVVFEHVPGRFCVQVTLRGVREVPQRGELHY